MVVSARTQRVAQAAAGPGGPTETQRIRAIFDKFDDDASGAWEIHEMEDFLASLDEADRKGLGLADARTVFDRLDEDGSGVIDFDEFKTWYLRVFADIDDGHLGDWQREHTFDGSIYYVHKRTGEASWTAPEGAYALKPLPGTINSQAVVLGPGATAAAPAVQAAPDRPLLSSSHMDRVAHAAKAARRKGAALVSSALASFQRAKHGKANRNAAQARQEAEATERKERAALKRAHQLDPDFVMPKKKWGTLTVVLLEGIRGIASAQTLVCRVQIVDARVPDNVLDHVEFRLKNAEDAKWNVKSVFELESPNCFVSTIFYRQVTPTKAAQPQLVEFGRLEEFIVDSNFCKWFAVNDPVADGSIIASESDLGRVKVECSIVLAESTSGRNGSKQDALPAGWECKVTPEGRVLYLNLDSGMTQWNHPALVDGNLPEGWEMQVDDQGRRYFANIHSGKAGVKESYEIQYTHPGEKVIARTTRHNLVSLNHHVTHVMKQKIDLNDPSLDRNEGLIRKQTAINAERNRIRDPAFKTFKGRLDTFSDPMKIHIPGGRQCSVGGWPHGFHLISDRPELHSALLMQSCRHADPSCNGDMLKTAKRIKLKGAIPVIEGFAYMRCGDVNSGRWDRLYFELKHISKAYGDQEKQALSSSLFSDAPPRAEWDRMPGERQLHYQKQKWPKMTIAERERYLQQMAPDDQSRFLSSVREVEEAMVLTWGQLDLTAVHHTKVAVKPIGRINTAILNKISCVALSSEDIANITMQNEVPSLVQDRDSVSSRMHTASMKALYGLRLESMGHEMKLAFLDKPTCMKWASAMRQPPTQRPRRLSPDVMASAGFIFAPASGQADRVLCVFCGVKLHGWRDFDDAMRVHAEACPVCPFVTRQHPDKACGHNEARPIARVEELSAGNISLVNPTLDDKDTTTRLPRGLKSKGKPQLSTAVVSTELHQNALMQHRQRMDMAMHSAGGLLLEMAAANSKQGVLEQLDQGAPIDFVDEGMRTALHWAACFGHRDIIQELLLRGANPNAKTALGFTPLALAKRGGFTQCSYLLEIEGSTETARVSSLDDRR